MRSFNNFPFPSRKTPVEKIGERLDVMGVLPPDADSQQLKLSLLQEGSPLIPCIEESISNVPDIWEKKLEFINFIDSSPRVIQDLGGNSSKQKLIFFEGKPISEEDMWGIWKRSQKFAHSDYQPRAANYSSKLVGLYGLEQMSPMEALRIFTTKKRVRHKKYPFSLGSQKKLARERNKRRIPESHPGVKSRAK